MKQRYWHIEGHDSFEKIYDKKVKFGCFSENQIKDLLKALTAKAAFSFNEIVGGLCKKKHQNNQATRSNTMKPLNLSLISRSFFILLIFYFLSLLTLHANASNRFVNNGDGTISDTKTGLMWVSKDNGFPINWPNAVEYCKNLRVGGYADWRMPTLDELESL